MPELRYSILDPTGNITALVESGIEAERQPEAAAAIMRLHPEVEQVGFLRADGADGLPELRMAGGEFCGNASMSAAALLLLRSGAADGPATVLLRVSGAAQPVEVRLRRLDADSFRAGVRMPPALELTEKPFRFGELRGTLPLVRMEGISHMIITPDSAFFALRKDRTAAEQAVREFCGALGAKCLGLMFLESEGPEQCLTPLVFVPGSGTVFWENSCASGSAAAGIWMAEKCGGPVGLTLRESGGRLRVDCDPAGGETWLFGKTRLIARYGENRENIF